MKNKFLIKLTLLILMLTDANADIFNVTKFTDDSNGCNSGVDCSLRSAINAANVSPGNDEIFLPAGTYNLTIGDIEIDGRNFGGIDTAISIFGQGDWNTSIVAGPNSPIFRIKNKTVQIFDVTLSGGYFQNSGGAIQAVDSLVAVVYATLINNESEFNGGAIFVGRNFPNQSNFKVISSRILNNQARNGSAIYCSSGSTCDIIDSTIEGNSANVAISSSHGAPIYVNSSKGIIAGSTIYNNSGTQDGGIYIDNSDDFKIVRSTISGNTALNSEISTVSGLKVNNSDNIVFENNTVTDNNSAGQRDVQFNGSTVSKFAKNVMNDNCLSTGSTITSEGHNLLINTDCSLTNVTDNQFVTNAEFNLLPLADNGGYTKTHAFGESSIIKNHQTAGCQFTDQRGVAHNDPSCDVGAFQSTPCSSPSLEILDNNASGISDTITVDSFNEISDLDILLNISHSYLADLKVTLEKVGSGITIDLVNRMDAHGIDNNCVFDDMHVILDEQATEMAEDQCGRDTVGPPFNAFPGGYARYVPETDTVGSLSDFDGISMNGQWQLRIYDLAQADVGTLNQWCLLPTTDFVAETPIFRDGFE